MVTENDDNSKSSEEYIIRLLQTIKSLDSMVRSLREELARPREKDAEHGVERRRLMSMIETKDKDISCLTQQMAQLLGKVDALTKALEDKSHQLANRNRDKFGKKTSPKTTRRVDDYVETSGFIPEDIKLKNIKETKSIGFR